MRCRCTEVHCNLVTLLKEVVLCQLCNMSGAGRCAEPEIAKTLHKEVVLCQVCNVSVAGRGVEPEIALSGNVYVRHI